ncbi:hypothetical protein Ahy_A05g024813 [Arachis hypogaea]|uniref:gluconokinase n=1 Tax=Arachis hypogaea TaxID=3818 RepID=A0A445D727_ARAHY|nr:hypothetical protein Ahy_A05g024813 [Arachis hypogaea]
MILNKQLESANSIISSLEDAHSLIKKLSRKRENLENKGKKLDCSSVPQRTIIRLTHALGGRTKRIGAENALEQWNRGDDGETFAVSSGTEASNGDDRGRDTGEQIEGELGDDNDEVGAAVVKPVAAVAARLVLWWLLWFSEKRGEEMSLWLCEEEAKMASRSIDFPPSSSRNVPSTGSVGPLPPFSGNDSSAAAGSIDPSPPSSIPSEPTYILFRISNSSTESLSTEKKMGKGIPLTDEDRMPWLESLRDATKEHIVNGNSVILGCSALKKQYRETLRSSDPDYKLGSYETSAVSFVLLEAPAEVLSVRLKKRAAEGTHYMPASLLQSQLDLLKIDESEGILRGLRNEAKGLRNEDKDKQRPEARMRNLPSTTLKKQAEMSFGEDKRRGQRRFLGDNSATFVRCRRVTFLSVSTEREMPRRRGPRRRRRRRCNTLWLTESSLEVEQLAKSNRSYQFELGSLIAR